MTWDGSGTHNRVHNFSADASAGIQAQAVRFDAEFNDVSTALENCQTLTGETTPTANSPMGGFKHTGVAAATSTDNYLRSDQASQQVGIFVRDTNAGVTGKMTASASPFPTAFTEGQRVTVKVSANGSALATRAIVINGLSANILGNKGDSIPAAQMHKDGYFDLVYDASASAFRTLNVGNKVAAEKSATENRSSDTTLSADSELTVAITTGTWRVELDAYFKAASAQTGMGIKWLLNYPGTFSRSRFSEVSMIDGAANVGGTVANSSTTHAAIQDTQSANLDFTRIQGVIVSTSKNNLSFHWAQNSSNAGNLAMNNTSSLVVTKIPS